MLHKELQRLLANSEKSQLEIEKENNFSKGYIHKVLVNEIKPSEDKLRKIVKSCNGDEEYFITSLWLESAPKEIEFKIDNILLNFLPMLESMYNKLKGNYDLNYNEIKEKFLSENKVKAFLELLSFNNILEVEENNIQIHDELKQIVLNCNSNGFIEIEDDNMSPIIPIKSKVGLKIQEKYNNGDIICFNYKDKIECRAIQKMSENRVLLYSYKNNKNYDLHINDFIILGKVEKVTKYL